VTSVPRRLFDDPAERQFVIRYYSRSTVRHGSEPEHIVGLVYVERVADRVKGYPFADACSYTKSLTWASRWTRAEAEERVERASWPEATVLSVVDAPAFLP
jgi:hypothetical protein